MSNVHIMKVSYSQTDGSNYFSCLCMYMHRERDWERERKRNHVCSTGGMVHGLQHMHVHVNVHTISAFQ